MTLPNGPRKLSDNDARVLDMLAEDGFDASRIDSLEEGDKPRAEAITNLLDLLEQYPVEEPSSELIDATLARINRAEQERDERMNFNTAASEQLSGQRWRFPDLFATAAMILLAVGVIWPVANSVRTNRIVAQDHDNLVENHDGISTYASANNGSTPMQAAATAGILPDPFEWMGGHSGAHNDAIREASGSHTQANDFYLPGGDPDQHAYSFQVWSPGDDLLNSSRMIASNTNPLPAMRSLDGPMDADLALQNSRSHYGSGQNVLYGDGRVDMIEVSEFDGDRIWDPGTTASGYIIEILRGEQGGEDVIFLVH